VNKRAVLVGILLLLSAPILTGAEEDGPVIICTTTVLGSIVEDLAGGEVEVVVITSASTCPAHYDVKPSDVEAVSRASLIFYHGMETWLDRLVEASGSNATLVKVSGPWNTPDGAISYYTRVAEALDEYLGLNSSDRLEKCVKSINSTADRLKAEAEAKGVGEVKVICMTWQKPFVSWLGFNVIAEFGPPEKLSSSDVAKLIEKGQEEGAMLVISNLQSGTGYGEHIADNVGAVHVVLTNFPDPGEGLLNLSHVFVHNAEALFDAMEEYGLVEEIGTLQRTVHQLKVLSCSLSIIAIVEAVILVYLLSRRK